MLKRIFRGVCFYSIPSQFMGPYVSRPVCKSESSRPMGLSNIAFSFVVVAVVFNLLIVTYNTETMCS